MDLTSKRDTSAEPAQSARRKLVERAPLYLVTFPADVENDEVLRMGRSMKQSSNEFGARCRGDLFRFPLAEDANSTSALVTSAPRDGQERSRRGQGIVVGPRPDPVSVLATKLMKGTSFTQLGTMMR